MLEDTKENSQNFLEVIKTMPIKEIQKISDSASSGKKSSEEKLLPFLKHITPLS